MQLTEQASLLMIPYPGKKIVHDIFRKRWYNKYKHYGIVG